MEVIADGKINDGFAIFDLRNQTSAILHGRSAQDYTVTYHESLIDAQNGTNPIVNPGSYTNTTNPQTIYYRIEAQFYGLLEYGKFCSYHTSLPGHISAYAP